MTLQERIEQNVRIALGDMQVQLIMSQARIAELEEQLAALTPKDSDAETNLKPRTNGKGAGAAT